MKPRNIISAYESLLLFNEEKFKLITDVQKIEMKKWEVETLKNFVELLKKDEDYIYNITNGYYIGYRIPQISKEFDLLRIGKSSIINIELKSSLGITDMEKMLTQMKSNFFYLKFLGRQINIFTYVDRVGLYYYNHEKGIAVFVSVSMLLKLLCEQEVDYLINLKNEFIPSNYLVSPFNLTDNFINDEYFLTDHQVNIKKEVINGLKDNIDKDCYHIYCLTGNAGTGKTLLTYDIAKTIQLTMKINCMIIHCANLNEGQNKLKTEHGLRITSIKNISKENLDTFKPKIIVVDESQRIRDKNLYIIIEYSIENNAPIIFSYDEKQYLSDYEHRKEFKARIEDLVEGKKIYFLKLKNRIRTNKEMASFVNNLFKLKSSDSYLDYSDITIDYFQHYKDAYDYIEILTPEWKSISFTASSYYQEPISNISNYSFANPHRVIGQEFNKVVLILNSNFQYDEHGILRSRKNYYSGLGMLYQIVTRTIKELKIIVVDNATLFYKLLQIKNYENNLE